MSGISAWRAVVFLLLGWGSLVLCGALQSVFRVGNLPGPDAVLLVVLFVGLSSRGSVAGVCALAVALGYFSDLLSGSPVGAHMLVYALLGIAARAASSRLLVRGPLMVAVVGGMFAAVFCALMVVLRQQLPSLSGAVGRGAGVGFGAFRDLPRATFSTMLFAPPIFWLLDRIERWFSRDPRALATS